MIDQKDKKILHLLQQDCRMSLTELAKVIGLSIDSTHKRLKKLLADKVFSPTIQVDPRKIGYPLTVDVKVKLKEVDDANYKKLISHMVANPYVISVFSAVGDYDLTCPIMARDHAHYQEIALGIRNKFKDVIADWHAAVNLEFFKYEYYDMDKL